MSINYAPKLPRDIDNNALQMYPPAKKTLQVFSKDNASVSSVISFTHDTTAVEVSAVGGAAVIKWIASTDTTASVISAASGANFDHVVSTGQTRRFVVPIESVAAGQGSVMGKNRAEGLYQRMAFKSVGVASVLTNEY